jgi:hypothetical protein
MLSFRQTSKIIKSLLPGREHFFSTCQNRHYPKTEKEQAAA